MGLLLLLKTTGGCSTARLSKNMHVNTKVDNDGQHLMAVRQRRK